MKEPVWVDKDALILLHAKGLARFGGVEGLRDEGLLDSALVRPQNAFHHTGLRDVAGLAATYAFGLVRNHPFVDGNKRVAFLAVGLFLGANGWDVVADPADAIGAVVALAEGKVGEGEFAAWLRGSVKRARS